MNRSLALTLLIVMGAGWGLTLPLSKIAVSAGYQHFGIIFWQLVIGVVVLGALNAIRGKGLPFTPTALALYLFIAMAGTLVPNGTSYIAIGHLPAGIMSIAIASVPILAFPIALALGEDKFGWLRLGGLLAGLGGVVLLTAPEASLPEPGMARWVLLALVGPLFYAIEGNVLAKWGTVGLDPVQALLGASLVGAVVAAPVALTSGAWINPLVPWGLPEWSIIVSAVVHSVIYALYVWVVGRAGATFAAQVGYLVTGFGVVWAMMILGESYSLWVWAAMGLILTGMFLVMPREHQPLPDAAEQQ